MTDPHMLTEWSDGMDNLPAACMYIGWKIVPFGGYHCVITTPRETISNIGDRDKFGLPVAFNITGAIYIYILAG